MQYKRKTRRQRIRLIATPVPVVRRLIAGVLGGVLFGMLLWVLGIFTGIESLVMFGTAVGTISSFDSLKTFSNITGTPHKPGTIPNGSDLEYPIGATNSYSWAFGSSGAGSVNQGATFIFTATANTTTTLDLSTVTQNWVGDANATFSGIFYLKFELLTTGQDATNGTAITGLVTIQPGASNPITTSPLGSSGTYDMKPGDVWEINRNASSTAITVGSTAKTLDFVNADTTHDGHFRVTVMGFK